MDQRGSLVDTNLKIYPSDSFIEFIEKIPVTKDVPPNILRYINHDAEVSEMEVNKKKNRPEVHFTNADIEVLNKIRKITNNTEKRVKKDDARENTETQNSCTIQDENKKNVASKQDNALTTNKPTDDSESEKNSDKLYLTISDVEWMYRHINVRKGKGEQNVPFLHELFQGSDIAMPQNRVIKRNPVLEARCVKLRAQQEAREYRKMTKGVDNVRMRYPEDSISYQLKQINRQLIAIGQFVISIFAGFLFGFRGVEWMVGNLDFGVRLLLGVMCALIIALAEIYFLAKKLNEELTMTETVQLGGPPKFANQTDNRVFKPVATDNKEHQD